ncbi:hypothetical protein ACLOJK_022718, partial [Asimina triloba]
RLLSEMEGGLDLGGGVGQALLAVDELLSPARSAKGATLLMGRSWPSSSPCLLMGLVRRWIGMAPDGRLDGAAGLVGWPAGVGRKGW